MAALPEVQKVLAAEGALVKHWELELTAGLLLAALYTCRRKTRALNCAVWERLRHTTRRDGGRGISCGPNHAWQPTLVCWLEDRAIATHVHGHEFVYE
jgi:hypothetical protein